MKTKAKTGLMAAGIVLGMFTLIVAGVLLANRSGKPYIAISDGKGR